jgi:hypothetical protein
MRKIIKNISFGLLTAGLIVGTALPTFAAYEMQAQQECIVKLDLMEVHLMLR